jgi:ornithine carbamoyltransferase
MIAKHLISTHYLSIEDLNEIMTLAVDMKAHPENHTADLQGKFLAMLFQKPSTRTRISFTVGIHQLGGVALVLHANELQLGRGETIADTARVVSRYVNGVMGRVFDNEDIVKLAEHATVPVINGLSDLLHPCQAICDYFTIREHFGTLDGMKIVYVGDGNNVAHSLAYCGAKLGVHLVISTPRGTYEPHDDVVSQARVDAQSTGATIEWIEDPEEAVSGAHVVYTDAWASMGQEEEAGQRRHDLARYQVNIDLFSLAAPEAIFMHCMPAHRGEEVTDEVADHERSKVFDQAENRLHTQKAIMSLLMSR